MTERGIMHEYQPFLCYLACEALSKLDNRTLYLATTASSQVILGISFDRRGNYK